MGRVSFSGACRGRPLECPAYPESGAFGCSPQSSIFHQHHSFSPKNRGGVFPGQDPSFLANLSVFPAVDQEGASATSTRQSVPVSEPNEESRCERSARFDLYRCEILPLFDHTVHFMARFVAPKIAVRLQPSMKTVLEELGDDHRFKESAL